MMILFYPEIDATWILIKLYKSILDIQFMQVSKHWLRCDF